MSKATVWKYEVPIFELGKPFTIDMPDHDCLDLQLQRGIACVWAGVDSGAPTKPQHFVWLGTGQHVPDAVVAAYGADYVGTVQLDQGNLVLHLFELEPKQGRPS